MVRTLQWFDLRNSLWSSQCSETHLCCCCRSERREGKRREEKGLKPSKGNVRICQEAATRSFTETKYNSFHRIIIKRWQLACEISKKIITHSQVWRHLVFAQVWCKFGKAMLDHLIHIIYIFL